MSDKRRSENFRWVFTNALGIQLSENEALITVGFAQDVTKPVESNVEEVGIIMTPRTAKLLMHVLQNAIGSWEKAHNTQIPIAPEKLAEIEKAMQTSASKKE